MIFLVWCALAASAHPFGARFAAHLIEVDVGREHVRVRYLADVPNPIVATATRKPGADTLQAMASELQSGLLLEIDGVSVALEPRGPWSAVPTEDTQQFSWSFIAKMPRGGQRVVVSNANLPDVAAVFRGRITITDGLLASDCTLWRMNDGAIALDETDRWRTDVRHRTLGVTVREPLGFLSPLCLSVFPARVGGQIAADARSPSPPPGPLLVGTALAIGMVGPASVWVVRRRSWAGF